MIMKIISIPFVIGSIILLYYAIMEISVNRSNEYGSTTATVQNISFDTRQVETSRSDMLVVEVVNTRTQYNIMVNYKYNVDGADYRGTYKGTTVYSNQEAEIEKNKILNNPSALNFVIYYKKAIPSESSLSFSANNSTAYFIISGILFIIAVFLFFAQASPVTPYSREVNAIRNMRRFGPKLRIVNNNYTNKYSY